MCVCACVYIYVHVYIYIYAHAYKEFFSIIYHGFGLHSLKDGTIRYFINGGHICVCFCCILMKGDDKPALKY